MKAAVIKSPGVIVVENVPTPEPAAGEVLLKIEACAICGTDQRVLAGTKPVDVPIVGHEITGRVEKIGAGVKGVKKGERYIVQTVIGCNACPACARNQQNLCIKGFRAMGYQFNGGFAEYMIMPKAAVDQGCLISIPETLSAEAGTLIEPLSCCVNGMQYMPMETLEHVVIFGGGIIGTLNGLVAKARGARCVTVMDVSQERLDLLKGLGLPFDHYVNSKQTDPAQWVKDHTGGRGVDAVVVAASVKPLVGVGMKLLAKGGHLSIFAGMPKPDSVDPIDWNVIHYNEINLHGANSSAIASYLTARDMIVSGKVDTRPLVTHRFKLDDFNKAVATQADPSSGALKVVIVP
jgi:L-iditol 2-dehydrogenase